MATTAHGTLAANVITTVSVESGRGGVVIVNPQQTGIIWVRFDGINPTPEGPGTYAVYGVREFPSMQRSRQVVAVEVRMLADTALDYSVEAY